MTKFKYLFLVCSFTCFISSMVFAQQKNEVEVRIKQEDFPQKALSLLKELPKHSKRIRYYKETDNDKTSFEVKLKIKRVKYSIEFDTDGNLEDVEITISHKALPADISSKINTYLSTTYKKYHLLKIQKQYVNPSDSSASDTLKKAFSNIDSPVNYELIAEVSSGSERSLKEFTFDHSGVFISQREISASSYEYVLY